MTAFAIGPAAAATASVSPPRALIDYDLAAGEQPENIAAEPVGAFDVVLFRAAKVERITPKGSRHPLASLPLPADGGAHAPGGRFGLGDRCARRGRRPRRQQPAGAFATYRCRPRRAERQAYGSKGIPAGLVWSRAHWKSPSSILKVAEPKSAPLSLSR